MRSGNRLFTVLNEQQQVNEKERRQLIKENKEITNHFESGPNIFNQYFKDQQFNAKKETMKEKHILDFFKQKINVINRYLHQNEDLNDGRRMTKDEFEFQMNIIKEEQNKEIWLRNQQVTPKMYYLSDSDYKDEKSNLHGNNAHNNVLDEKIKRTMDERDNKIKSIEEDINYKLNAIENYQLGQQMQQQEYLNKQLKETDLKGLRQQVFVNPRQTKLRKNIEMLMGELKNIKAIDPDLKIFNSIYRKRQSTYEIKGQSKNQLSSKGKTELNEIDILMEILSAADLRTINQDQEYEQEDNNEVLSDLQTVRIEENPLSDRAITHQEPKRQLMPYINNIEKISRIQTAQNQQKNLEKYNQSQLTLKRAAASQPSLLGFGKNKFTENQLIDIQEKVQLSPLQLDRLTKIDKVLRKTCSTQMKYDFAPGTSLIGGKDYQGRVRNIFLEQRRKLETQVQKVDDEIQQMDQTKIKAKNFEYYSIKDIMSDQWVQQLTNQKQQRNLKIKDQQPLNNLNPIDFIKEHNDEVKNPDSSMKSLKSKSHRNIQDKLSIGNKKQIEDSPGDQNPFEKHQKAKLQKNQSQQQLKSINNSTFEQQFKTQRKPIQILNIDSLKKDIGLFNKEIQDFNKTIFRNQMHNSNTSTQAGVGQFQSQDNYKSQGAIPMLNPNHSTFDNQSYTKLNIMSPQQEAQEKKLESLRPLKKIRKVIQYTTKGVEL
ncbi:UNKNOWN [Stylonychia lemnae]|uniref:Uncharacterized protein n=1 Tax=Stylonychia lemnae TaxID=5949 RepID=A0A077ZYG8_STYLE|nr:UNKNOWN [Stylonychia lemnae]|eukprot:CDW74986.1 UNKNOWN [Stylonychia lemnae]